MSRTQPGKERRKIRRKHAIRLRFWVNRARRPVGHTLRTALGSHENPRHLGLLQAMVDGQDSAVSQSGGGEIGQQPRAVVARKDPAGETIGREDFRRHLTKLSQRGRRLLVRRQPFRVLRCVALVARLVRWIADDELKRRRQIGCVGEIRMDKAHPVSDVVERGIAVGAIRERRLFFQLNHPDLWQGAREHNADQTRSRAQVQCVRRLRPFVRGKPGQ